MAKWDEWLRMQRTQVESGVIASRIVLQSADGEPYGTWSLGTPSLESSVDVVVRELTDALPKGQHQFRLVALDENKQQLSALPLVFVGASPQATDAAAGRINEQRANALVLSNAEKIVSLYRDALDASADHLQAMREGMAQRDRHIARLEALTDDRQKELIRVEAREQRLTAIANQFAPLVEIGIGLMGQFGAEWLESRAGRSGRAQVQSVNGQSGPTPSEQPPISRPASGDSQPELPAPHGVGGTQGNGASSAEGNAGGRPKPGPAVAERTRTTERVSSVTSDRKRKVSKR